MPGISPRNRLASWLRGMRAAMENFSDELHHGTSGSNRQRNGPLAAARCVWYGRAMFCLYVPDPAAPPRRMAATGGDDPGSDLHPRPRLDHPVVRKLEEPDRARGVAAHRDE